MRVLQQGLITIHPTIEIKGFLATYLINQTSGSSFSK